MNGYSVNVNLLHFIQSAVCTAPQGRRVGSGVLAAPWLTSYQKRVQSIFGHMEIGNKFPRPRVSYFVCVSGSPRSKIPSLTVLFIPFWESVHEHGWTIVVTCKCCSVTQSNAFGPWKFSQEPICSIPCLHCAMGLVWRWCKHAPGSPQSITFENIGYKSTKKL